MAVTANFAAPILTVSGDGTANPIVIGRDAGGNIRVNGGAIAITGGTPTVSNTTSIKVTSFGGSEQLSVDHSFGPIPAVYFDAGSGKDTLFGGSLNDTLIGGTGNDFISASAGNDRIIWTAGDGFDTIDGDNDLDTVEANGADTAEQFSISINAGHVVVSSGADAVLDIVAVESLKLRLNGGADSFDGTALTQNFLSLDIDGGAGNDTLLGGDFNDRLAGGSDNDSIRGGKGTDTVLLGSGNDTAHWTIGDGNDTVDGGSGTDSFILDGSANQDIVTFRASGRHLVTLNGSTDMPKLDLDNVETLRFNAAGGVDNIFFGDLSSTDIRTVILDLASIVGGSSADGQGDYINFDLGEEGSSLVINNGTTVVKNAVNILHSDNIDSLGITGGEGNDRLEGRNLVIKTTIAGGEGNDTILAGGADVVYGEGGNDLLITSDADNQYLDGGAGIDTVDLQAIDTGLVFNLNGGSTGSLNRTFAAFENAIMGDGADQVTGTDVDNKIYGNEGADSLDGGFGADYLSGGADDDTLVGSFGADTLVGGDGLNSLRGGTGSDLYIVTTEGNLFEEGLSSGRDTIESSFSLDMSTLDNFEVLILKDTAATGIGNSLDNLIRGNSSANRLDGGVGNDTMEGGGNNDTYVVDSTGDVVTEAANAGSDTVESSISYTLGANVEHLKLTGSTGLKGTGNALANIIDGTIGNNSLNGGDGNDTLRGGGGNDTLTGSAGNDSLLGGSSSDTLSGGDGDDRIYGGSGNDRLSGSAGKDHFVFDTTLNSKTNFDTITSFSSEDLIELDKSTFSAFTATGALASGAFRSNMTGQAEDKSDRIIYDEDSGALYYDADGTDAIGRVKFAVIETMPAMNSADFLIIA